MAQLSTLGGFALMDKIHSDFSTRLIVGVIANLWLITLGTLGTGFFNYYSDDSSHLHFEFALVDLVMAVLSLDFTARVLWRGVSSQRAFAALLIPIPAIVVFDFLRFCLTAY
jgi:hypothetical protein